ncbi:MAG: hypothetical protein R3E79_57940 [Caldilineaceae bacterium]
MNYQRETLVASLRQHGIAYLAPSDAMFLEPAPDDEALFLALVSQPDSRLQLALVPLLIRRPELAMIVEHLSKQLDPVLALDLKTYYMAAVYLQRLWRTRLGFYIDNTRLLPDLFSQQMGCHPPMNALGKQAYTTWPICGRPVRIPL